jgi:hypothetical protein
VKSASSAFGRKVLRVALGGVGVSLIISSAVNVFAAYQLIEVSDEAAVGISRNEIVVGYLALGLAGALLIGLALRLRR